MADLLGVLVGYGIVLLIFFWLSKDAERHKIYLSRNIKILFLLTFTAPFVIIWYMIKRVKNNKGSQTDDIDDN